MTVDNKADSEASRMVLRELSDTYSSELLAKKGRLDALIGAAHWLSVGNYKEALVRGLLVEKVPRRFEVSTGFVMAFSGKKVTSRQIDVLIWDSHNHPPIFRDGDFVVIPPEACRAAIEVKGNLSHEQLEKGIENLASLDQFASFCRHEQTIYRAIFAYDSELSFPKPILDKIYRNYSNAPLTLDQRIEETRQLQREDVHWIDAIAVLGQGVVARERWTINGLNHVGYSAFKTIEGHGGVPIAEKQANDTYGFIERTLLASLISNGVLSAMHFTHPGSYSVLMQGKPEYSEGASSLVLPVPDKAAITSIGQIDSASLPTWINRIYLPRS